ncbi:hypothetical protein [Mycobacterium talmoniae]|uniref:VWFA domain-containing protein n=1 Tax=Mycobacterium talmoniae TaxID=1858794 RepID=A0A1S1NEA2_9MYCO|nr:MULTISPECIES: hypothetical protein [Mycobacterium]OHV03964.1 hypothetical protein BKN37_12180 [Mycobacterium talmoniae]TDH57162.1 hypothetical protein E2F47_03105 [Mycobacterium eburneum]
MGRHSIPGPDDDEYADEPFDDEPYDHALGDEPDAGRWAGSAGQHRGDVGRRDYFEAPGGYPEPGDYPPHRGYHDDDGDALPFDDDYEDYGEYDDEDLDEPALEEEDEPPTGRVAVRAGRRGMGEWRGGHRSEGGRRGVSLGVIAALVAVVLVVGTVILWRFFGHTLSHRSDAAAGRCVEGDLTVAVIADPAIADRIQGFAERFNDSAKPVGDRCVQVTVKSAGADAVVSGFIGDWPAKLGERPALWIPGSSVSSARLQAVAGRETITDSRSLVTSPVLLAIRPELKPALEKQSWASLPELQSKPDALAALKLPGWGSLRLALPLTDNSDAAFLAAEAVAAASAPRGAPASAGTGAVRTLVGAQPKLADDTVTEAMNALLRPGDRAAAPVHAVVTTEQQLFARGESLSDAGDTLTSWLPPGPAAVADYPLVLLSGSWLSPEQVSAASEFARFARKADQLADLAKAGFRVEGVSPPHSDVTSFAGLPSTLSVGDDELRATLATTLTAPTAGPAVTIMLDQSMTADEAGKSRLANVVAALNDRIKALPPNAAVGLWTFNGTEGKSVVAGGPLADDVDGKPRTDTLTGALDGLSSTSGGAVSFTTLRMVYGDAVANFRDGQTNSVLVITAGPHTDRTLDGPGLQDYIRGATDPARPVAVNVIDFGDDPDRATWEAVAQLSGGSYRNLSTSGSPELAAAVSTLLG